MTRKEILLVEDDANDVEFTTGVLKRRDLAADVTVVRDGAEALEYMFAIGAYSHRRAATKPSLVLLDLRLPKVSGIEVLREFKADTQARLVPVVMLTSSAQEQDIVVAYELGVNSYIVKPVSSEAFELTVAEAAMYWMTLNRAPNER